MILAKRFLGLILFLIGGGLMVIPFFTVMCINGIDKASDMMDCVLGPVLDMLD